MSLGSRRRWLLPTFIVVGLFCVFVVGGKISSPVNNHVEYPISAEGQVLVIPIQIERDSYGLAMVDTVGQTLWIYEINSRGPAHNRLRLLAARSWRYDRLLQNLNTAEPKPEKVKMILQSMGQFRSSDENKKQDGDVNILKIAEPNNRDSNG